MISKYNRMFLNNQSNFGIIGTSNYFAIWVIFVSFALANNCRDMTTDKQLTIDDIHRLTLEIMKDIDRFCRANNIPYTLSSGTLLGAVRHGGFIPWDDDADMFMLREDFERFVSIYKSDKYQLNYNINKFDATEAKKQSFYGFAKVVDNSVTSIDKRGKDIGGVWVDIFPLDPVPEDPKIQHDYMHRIMSIHNRLYHRQRTDIVSIIKSYRHSLRWWVNRLNTATHDTTYADSPLVAHIVGSQNYRTIINRDRFETLTDIEFEGYKFLGFSDTHSYLSMVYGADYMTPKQWSHNTTVFQK